MPGIFMDLLTKKAPELPKGKWLNAKQPLSLGSLKGSIVILNFWGYPCAKCPLILQVLSSIEKKYRGKPVVIIGVHKTNFRAMSACVKEYGITHPVVTDENGRMGGDYFVTEWPSLVIIGPAGKIAFKLAGEYSISQLSQLIDSILEGAAQNTVSSKKA